MSTKICNNCKVEKDLQFYFKDKKLKSGYRGQCKDCVKKYDLSRSVIIIPNDTSTKICNICNLDKPLNNYYTSKKTIDGYYGYCKTCSNNKKINNPNTKINSKKYKAKYKLKYGTTYNLKNRERNREKYKMNISFRLKSCIRSRINKSLKTKFSQRTMDIVGCDIYFFKKWIEYQFEDWMSWENFGEWHLDHVRPCSNFNFSCLEELKCCFNWKNYQPLKKELNLSKYNKVLEDLIKTHTIKANSYLSLTSKEAEGSETRTSNLMTKSL